MVQDRVLCLRLPDDPPPHLIWAAEELLARVGRPWRAAGSFGGNVGNDAADGPLTLALNTALPGSTPGLSVQVDRHRDSFQLARRLAAGRSEDMVTQGGPGRYHLAVDVAAAYLDWLGRREETDNPDPDTHGRIARENTVLAAAGLGEFPAVDVLASLVDSCLERAAAEAGKSLPPRHNPWSDGAPFVVFLSHDVDYFDGRTDLWKRYCWWVLQSVLMLCRGRGNEARQLWRKIDFWRKTKGDPEYTIRRLAEIESRHDVRSSFYFLCSCDRSVWGKLISRTYSLEDQRVQRDVRYLAAGGWEVGVHGLYGSYRDADALREQKRLLESVAERTVTGIRQHYLRVHQFDTASAQDAAGFTYDTSLGWSSHPGCRSATVLPYRIWDCRQSRSLNLWEVPLLVMDCSLDAYGPAVEDKLSGTEYLWKSCREHGGVFSLLIHTDRLNGFAFPNWLEFVEAFLDRCAAESVPVLTGASLIETMQQFRDDLHTAR